MFRKITGLILLVMHFATCRAAKRPSRTMSLRERLDSLPLGGAPVARPVSVHWNDYQVPFLEAEADTDLATALGLVHAHLRLAQMEMVRRLALGRLSEMIGPVATDLDHLLRLFDFGRAVPEILKALPTETREWLDAFAGGINHCLDRADQLPPEFAVLNLEREPWSAADILTIGRLAAADVNWAVWLRLLPLRTRTGWPRLWRRLLEIGEMPAGEPVSLSPRPHLCCDVLALAARWASNSIAIGPQHSASGSALLASDPHLGIHLPGPWLIAGYKSPSHHAVGLMAPGLPFIALGRNPFIAWGGANMHAASSDFYDVSDLPRHAIAERRDVIKVRWWPDREVVLRDTALGPIISDARLAGLDRGTPVALRWMGHEPSDEITAMLKVSQARNWEEFRSALDGISVSGQTMTYADARGHIGRAMAVRLPARQRKVPPDLLLESGDTGHWRSFVTGSDLPATLDPADGFLVSANELPPETAVPVGFFFSPLDRAQRLAELVSSQSQFTLEALTGVLKDTFMASSRDLGRQFASLLQSRAQTDEIIAGLAEWDGHYCANSRGALTFELTFHHFVRAFYDQYARRAYWATWSPRSLVHRDIARSAPDDVARVLERAVRRAARAIGRFKTWGAMHRLVIAHPFSLVPVFGRRFVVRDLPGSGGSESILKTAHGFVASRHGVIYGSGARHVSDLSGPDHNYFVLLGGQDGWWGSTNSADQIDLWQAGKHVQIPLQPHRVHHAFPHRTDLIPSVCSKRDPSKRPPRG